MYSFDMRASLLLALVPKECNFIALLTLFQQFLIALLFSISYHSALKMDSFLENSNFIPLEYGCIVLERGNPKLYICFGLMNCSK